MPPPAFNLSKHEMHFPRNNQLGVKVGISENNNNKKDKNKSGKVKNVLALTSV